MCVVQRLTRMSPVGSIYNIHVNLQRSDLP